MSRRSTDAAAAAGLMILGTLGSIVTTAIAFAARRWKVVRR